MARKRSREFVYVETDGQVYLVRDRGTFRFPRADERLPFPTQPNGRMDLGESPEVGVEREAEEEIGVDIRLDGLLDVFVSGFPGKPAYTLGFVYKGHVASEDFRLKPDEIEDVGWFTVDKAMTLTRNPFAKWGLVDFFVGSPEARRALRVRRHGVAGGPTS